ncbi:hypothetical protein GIB67_037463 [Kingdonia uniflora]|uniref:Vesicle transport protein n=1 Tax=Kingdonia uniflora TaxID=39325 RepID=A0A7J7NCG7_9MAGN|nr:hypothetical protein GIB67_037463 [Kingdonia uniflora]
MQKHSQSWFLGGPSTNDDPKSSSSSLLADWNSYAAASKASERREWIRVDIEAAVRSANDTVSGTFNVVSKGVRDLPGNLQSATSNVPSGKSLTHGVDASEICYLFYAWVCFIIGSFFALKGPKNQLQHMLSQEDFTCSRLSLQRLPSTLGFVGSMVGTIYVSMVLHSYILSVLFSVLQVIALSYYAISYFPGGSAGLKFLTSTLTTSVLKCFGR